MLRAVIRNTCTTFIHENDRILTFAKRNSLSPDHIALLFCENSKFVDGSSITVKEWKYQDATGKVSVTIEYYTWVAMPTRQRCHSTFIDGIEKKCKQSFCYSNETKNIGCKRKRNHEKNDTTFQQDIAYMQSHVPFIMCPFQLEGVKWMASKEGSAFSMLSDIFRVTYIHTQDRSPVYACNPNPSETVLYERKDIPLCKSGGFLCDEPGLGKTVQMVALMNLTGFHYRDTPTWVKGAYSPWVLPTSSTSDWFQPFVCASSVTSILKHAPRRLTGWTTKVHPFPLKTMDDVSDVIARRMGPFDNLSMPFTIPKPETILGGTLVIFPTALSAQWKHEILDKSLRDDLEVVVLSKEISVSCEKLRSADVVLVTHGILRAERRRSDDRVAWGNEWTCFKWIRSNSEISANSASTPSILTLKKYDIVQIIPWGTEFVVNSVNKDGRVYGWPWNPIVEGYSEDGAPEPTTSSEFTLFDYEWKVSGVIRVCGTKNVVKESVKKSEVFCTKCGSKPGHRAMINISKVDPSPLFRIQWRRIILDESDRLTSMHQTHADVSILRTNVMWCLTGTPNGTDPRFGENFFEQLSLFFNKLNTEDMCKYVHAWRDPAFQGDLVKSWLLRRTFAEVSNQLSVPTVETHDVYVDLEEKDGREWIMTMHRDMAKTGSHRFGRMWRVLTVQKNLCETILVDSMEVSSKTIDETDIICAICFDKIDTNTCMTPCGHTYCKTCIHTWSSVSSSITVTCPACREPITTRKLKVAINTQTKLDSFTPGNLCKLREIKKLLERIPADDKVVIAARYPEAIRAIMEELQCPGLYSKMSRSKRDAILVSDWDKCIVISSNLYGFGLNLTKANHLIIVDEPIKHHHKTQLIGRIHRIGQTKHVHVYRLITRGTLEEWVDYANDPNKLSQVMQTISW